MIFWGNLQASWEFTVASWVSERRDIWPGKAINGGKYWPKLCFGWSFPLPSRQQEAFFHAFWCRTPKTASENHIVDRKKAELWVQWRSKAHCTWWPSQQSTYYSWSRAQGPCLSVLEWRNQVFCWCWSLGGKASFWRIVRYRKDTFYSWLEEFPSFYCLCSNSPHVSELNLTLTFFMRSLKALEMRL